MTPTIESLSVPLHRDAHGVIKVSETRVTLDTVINAFLDGATAEEIAHRYPVLPLADVYAVIGFYLRRRPEIDAYLEERERNAEDVRLRNEARCDPQGIRDRLLARRASGG